MYPIDIDLPLAELELPVAGTAADILKVLKNYLPYTLRYENAGGKSRDPHQDLAETHVELQETINMSARGIITDVTTQLPAGWHATKLPSHVIMYKNDKREISCGERLALSD